MSYSGLDTYNEHSSLNPANQDEKESVVSWAVIVDDEPYDEYDNEADALIGFKKVINEAELEFENLGIDKVIDGMYYPTKYQVNASSLFLKTKELLARIKEIESFPMDLTSDEQQELRELKNKLYNLY